MVERSPARGTERDEEEPDETREPSGASREAGERRNSRRRPSRRLTAAQVARAAASQIAEFTGKQPEGITGVEPAEDGWVVGVEVVEDRRVPSAADILATYEMECDASGEMISYRRLKRYQRGRGDSEDS